MNRVIKFRGWHKPTSKMIDLHKTTPIILHAGKLQTDGLYLPFIPELELMQFTGLLDCVGVEVFEGDVLKCKDHPTGIESDTYQVIFKRGCFVAGPCPLESWGTAWIEVIGNIYQHPHLLK